MGKILLIEPHRVLQQAIALSLFPEHEVQVDAGAGASTVSLDGMDLVIVDAAALRESNRLSPELLCALESASIPTLWIEDNGSVVTPKRDKLSVLMKPIESATFQSALADLLPGSRLQPERKKTVSGVEKTPAIKSGNLELEPIELVEIVEEESPSEKRASLEKKSK